MVAQPIAVLQAVPIELAERRLRHFVRQAWHVVEPFAPFKPNWHLDAIADHLEAVEHGEIRNLLVTMPPRMGKSLTISVFYPAWRWINKPGMRFLYASYSQDLATAHSLATRRVIESDWYQARWGGRFQLAGDANLKTRFENDQRGQRYSTSVGGVVTGVGGDRIVVDDPHNVKESESEAVRATTIAWWDQAMSTRFNDPKTGARIVVMQRVHEGDLAGHLIEQGGYTHLNLPMEYEPESVTWTGLGTPDPRSDPGELLAPDRVGPDELADLKVRLGSRAYAGQFQQRPSPAEGGTFKRQWWRFWHFPGHPLDPVPLRMPDGSMHLAPCVELPPFWDEHLQSWDMSFKGMDTSDYVCGQVWGAWRADRYLLDQTLAQLNFPATLAAVRELTDRWPKARRKLVEDKANGPAVIATLRNEIAGLVAVEPEGGKESRANAVTPEIESGNVYLPHPRIAPWVDAFIDECASFPTGKHDDQVDSMTQALLRLAAQTGSVVISRSYLEGANDEDEGDRERRWD